MLKYHQNNQLYNISIILPTNVSTGLSKHNFGQYVVVLVPCGFTTGLVQFIVGYTFLCVRRLAGYVVRG